MSEGRTELRNVEARVHSIESLPGPQGEDCVRRIDVIDAIKRELAEAALRAETAPRESQASTFGDEWTHLQWLKALGYETCVGTSPFDSFEDIETAIRESPKLARAWRERRRQRLR